VVAGRGGNHAAFALLVGEEGNAVSSAAYLEGASTLQALSLEPDVAGAAAAESGAVDKGSAADERGGALPGGLDVGKGDGWSRRGLCCHVSNDTGGR
jgi:hypothetical protein